MRIINIDVRISHVCSSSYKLESSVCFTLFEILITNLPVLENPIKLFKPRVSRKGDQLDVEMVAFITFIVK